MSLTQDEREWLHRIEDKIDRIFREGCAKSPLCADTEQRLRTVEQTQAEVRGRAATIGAVAAMVASAVFAWIGRHV